MISLTNILQNHLIRQLNEHYLLVRNIHLYYFCIGWNEKQKDMKAIYQISSEVTGKVSIRRGKIVKRYAGGCAKMSVPVNIV